jgi:uncharacterized protein (UPF0276 family)
MLAPVGSGRQLAGIGVGLRDAFAAELVHTTRRVDFLEIVPECWTKARTTLLAPHLERWPIVPHSTALSIGGPEPFDGEYIRTMREICRQIAAPFFSDHICYSFINGLHTGELLPLPFSEEAAEHTVRRIREVQDRLDVPLVLENASYYATMPGTLMDEASFILTLLSETECGMLLDVNNVYVNSRNHAFDPYAFIDRMPLDRVWQLHVAGHGQVPSFPRVAGLILDTHRGPIIEDVWALYRHTLTRAGRLIPTIIEWDLVIPPLDVVLDEVDRARQHAVSALGTMETA